MFFPATIKKKSRICHVKCQLFIKFVFILSWFVSQSNTEKKKSGIFSFTTFRWILENCLMPKNIYWPVHVHIYLSAPCNALSATQRFFFSFLPQRQNSGQFFQLLVKIWQQFKYTFYFIINKACILRNSDFNFRNLTNF